MVRIAGRRAPSRSGVQGRLVARTSAATPPEPFSRRPPFGWLLAAAAQDELRLRRSGEAERRPWPLPVVGPAPDILSTFPAPPCHSTEGRFSARRGGRQGPYARAMTDRPKTPLLDTVSTPSD